MPTPEEVQKLAETLGESNKLEDASKLVEESSNKLSTLKEEAGKRLSAVEEKLKAQEKKFAAEVESAKFVQLEGRINETRASLEEFDKRMYRVVDQTNSQASKLMDQISALEQTLLSLGKMMTAISEVLTSKGLVTGDEVMESLSKAEDRRTEEQITEMVKLGILSTGPEVGLDSIVILREQEILKDGTAKLVTDYRLAEIFAMKKDDPFRTELLGKKAGDVIAYVHNEQQLSFLVKTVYNVNREGSKQPAQG